MFRKTRLGLAAVVASLGLVATTSPAATALPDWRTGPSTRTTDAAIQPKTVDLRFARHPHFDRVVIDLNGRWPGYSIRYTKTLTYDGSGAKVPLRGKRKMSLALQPAYAHNRKGANVYEGPRLRQLCFPTLRGVAFTGDFEGVVSFGFTTDRRAPYRIFTLRDPNRIVIDWQH
jgi:hypothetical protein